MDPNVNAFIQFNLGIASSLGIIATLVVWVAVADCPAYNSIPQCGRRSLMQRYCLPFPCLYSKIFPHVNAILHSAGNQILEPHVQRVSR